MFSLIQNTGINTLAYTHCNDYIPVMETGNTTHHLHHHQRSEFSRFSLEQCEEAIELLQE